MTTPPAKKTLKLPPRPPRVAPGAPARAVAAPAVATPVARASTHPPAGKPGHAKPRKRPVTALRTKAPPAPAAPIPATEGDRLSKRVAALVPCSRTEAEQYIEGGWVRVDGTVVEEPQFRVRQQTIAIDPNATLLAQPPVTLLLHKPADWVDGTEESLAKLNRKARREALKDARTLLVAANHSPQDPSGIRLLQRHLKQHSAMVPLENAASGLIVFTQDWRIERKLNDEMGSMEHEVMVDVAGEVSPQALHLLTRTLDADASLPLVKVSLNSSTPARSTLRFAIKGAHRGLIAHLCERAQLDILEMRRIRLGRVGLRDLPVGQWRFLAPGERF